MTTRTLEEVIRVREMLASGEVRRLRERHRLRVAEIARAIPCAHSSYLRWESGSRVPTEAHALRLGRVLDMLEDQDRARAS